MKNLKDSILEKLKISPDNNTNLDINNPEVVVDYLCSDNITKRQSAIDCIREEVINYNCPIVKRTNKIKSSRLYFIQFSKIKIDSETPDSLMILRQLSYDDYYSIIINADDNIYNKKIMAYREPWNRTQPNLNPKTAEIYNIPFDCPVYEICKIMDSKKF